MNKRQKILLVTAIIVAALSAFYVSQKIITEHFVKKELEIEKLKKNWPKKYCYFVQSENNQARDGLCIFKIEDKDSMISYYDRMTEKFEPNVNFNSEVINKDSSIYFIENTKEDPRIAKIFVERSSTLNQIRYVYCKLLHDKRYNDSIQ